MASALQVDFLHLSFILSLCGWEDEEATGIARFADGFAADIFVADAGMTLLVEGWVGLVLGEGKAMPDVAVFGLGDLVARNWVTVTGRSIAVAAEWRVVVVGMSGLRY